MKKVIATILAASMLMSMSLCWAIDAGQARAVMGNDISAEQKADMYRVFGVTEGTIPELTVTNEEERQYLNGLVDESIIGTKSISCVYVETLSEGSGLQVEVSNVSWCTKEMYVNALVTAGITDARMIVASPVTVSGTAALTGVYKAYEDISGKQLDAVAKLAGTQELVVTAELADEIGSYDAVEIVNQLKLILGQTVSMTDAEVKAEIESIAKQYNVSLSDGQEDQLVSLCRSLEGLDPEELKAKVEQLQGTLKSLAGVQSTVTGIWESVSAFFASVGNAITGFLKNIGIL